MNIDFKYPALQINLDKIYENAKNIVKLCSNNNIKVAGVVKGINAIPEVADEFVKAGVDYMADAKLSNIIKLKEHGINLPMMLIITPMMSEVHNVVKYVDISVNSEIEVLKLLDKESQKQNKKHKVVLMYDVGDLREGIFKRDEFVNLALYVEKNLHNICLYGMGTNVGCYGAIKPTEKNIGELADIASEIEDKIGRKLDMISGGATTCISLLLDNKMPSEINNLRVGEAILLSRDLPDIWGYNMNYMNEDAIKLQAEVIEVQRKPTFPIGERIVDSFGLTREYEDKGIRKRALLAVGRQEYAFEDKLIPLKEGAKIIGGSSNHLIVDVEDCTDEVKVGDILEFEMFYAPMPYLSQSKSVKKILVKDGSVLKECI
ncbi:MULTISPECIES: alanine/ornithine racemase family PLP-dependent enzyme [Clostridium]|uniref:alanine/ornithine racemase family PLP-dependent enzyme n=1 Tax=Clostridium TaxID=1485 RepID=UPI000824CCE2|nr:MULTISPECIES: alanine/ornithine racemase family PLP-dependent enzyme [Clostridium]PJI07977.1 alanine racemase [Clostridium sp. CT7]